jgi:hypothetical protein
LRFPGELSSVACPLRSVKKHKHKKKHKRDKDAADAGDEGAAATVGEEQPEAVRVKGSGRISSSDTVVHGVGTKFMSEFRPGDGLEIEHPTSYALPC